jgi:hypothetical protein
MFEAFYRDYVTTCAELGIAPLSADELTALIETLVMRPSAALH